MSSPQRPEAPRRWLLFTVITTSPVLPRALLNLEPGDLPLRRPGRLHRPRAGTRTAPAGIVCTPAFASQTPDALKGQPELQDPPAGSEGPRGPGPRLRQPRGSRTRGRPRGPTAPSRGPTAPSRGPRPPSRAPSSSGPPRCPHLGPVPRRPLAAATAAARPPRIHSNPQPGAGSGKPRARAARACLRPEGGPEGGARKGAGPSGPRELQAVSG